MKIVIALISMVLMVRGCYGAVIYANDGGTNAVLERASPSSSSSSGGGSSSNSSSSESNENPLQNIVKCFKADSLLKCVNDRVGLLVRFWREALLNSVRRNGNDNLHWSQSLEYTLRDLGKAIYYGITAFFQRNDDGEARSALDNSVESSDTSIERGHKKKKVHKEIKKLVIKVIVAIFLVMQKIKWALLMIQTILLNNFILVATLFVLTKTFKIWHEIKHYKHHQNAEKQIIVYDNVHHQHVDDLAHSEYEDGHGHSHGWNWWGARSFQTQTEAPVNEPEYENDYYSSRVVRSTRDRPRRRRRSNTS